jgi:C1A family cysteine protease
VFQFPYGFPSHLCSDSYVDGCDGGDTGYAYYYVYENGGLELNASYPYTSYWGTTGTCDSDSKDYVVTVTDFSVVDGEESMADHVATTGPLSVCLHADDSWYYYESGIMSDCGMDVNHCVQAVGVNFDEEYWMVRNSWGSDWGVDGGYIFLKLVSDLNIHFFQILRLTLLLSQWNNTCNIDDYPTYVVPKLV